MDLKILASLSAASFLASVIALLVVWAVQRYLRTVFRCVLLFTMLFSCLFVMVVAVGTGVASKRFGYEGMSLQLVGVTCLMGVWLSVSTHMLCTLYDVKVLQIVSKKMARNEWLPPCITHVLTGLCVCFLASVGQNVCGDLRT